MCTVSADKKSTQMYLCTNSDWVTLVHVIDVLINMHIY